LACGTLVDIERLHFDIEGGFIREQFPLILGWASTMHKVQGMQFEKLKVDFCLDTGVKAVRDSNRPFRAGMAYMALSRSENVFIQGSITLELLNNVNRHALLAEEIVQPHLENPTNNLCHLLGSHSCSQ
jgi:hypothetical protein